MSEAFRPTSLEPLRSSNGAIVQRAQALRLVRYLFGADVDPALATSIANWIISGSWGPVREAGLGGEEA